MMKAELKTNRKHKRKPIGSLPRNATSRVISLLGTAFADLTDTYKGYEHTVRGFKAKYQLDSWLSKYCITDKSSSALRATAAVDKWLSVDKANERSNERIQFDTCEFRKGRTAASGRVSSETVLSVARHVIARIIGTEPPEDIFEMGQFTNGASTRIPRRPDAVSLKFVGEAHVTPSAWPHFQALLGRYPGWTSLINEFGLVPEFVDESFMFTVPKNSDIDRVACKEPEINMFLQRAIGNFFRKQLKEVAVFLNDQSVNKRLAQRGSYPRDHREYLHLATIDLSSASDSVTTSLVMRLLPPAWTSIMNDVRVKYTRLPSGEVHELNMFSSMGNGFTFELESLIFYSLAKAAQTLLRVDGRLSVYGDDIIINTDLAPRFARILSWFGFKVNTKKSFWGKFPFRESCGGHFYRGVDVTPFYFREPLKDQRDLINQLNQLREWIVRDSVNGLWVELPDKSDMLSVVDVWYELSGMVWFSAHGGRDLEDPSALVTPARPKNRYVNRSEDLLVNQEGGYLHWLQCRERVCEDAVTSTVSETGRLVLATNRTWERALPVSKLFIRELPGGMLPVEQERSTEICMPTITSTIVEVIR